MTVSVPPSAARVARLSAERAARRAAKTASPLAVDDANTPRTPPVDQTQQQQQQQQRDDDGSLAVKKQKRWYMGQYADADGNLK